MVLENFYALVKKKDYKLLFNDQLHLAMQDHDLSLDTI